MRHARFCTPCASRLAVRKLRVIVKDFLTYEDVTHFPPKEFRMGAKGYGVKKKRSDNHQKYLYI